jgi:hypothetical protein
MKNRVLFIIGFVVALSITASAQRITVTLAGNGSSSHSGDGGPGKSGTLQSPNDICMDGTGNFYFVEAQMIRKLSAKGILTTIAGGGTLTGDGVPATNASISPQNLCVDGAGNVYITTDHKIRKIDGSTGLIKTIAGSGTSGYTGDGGPATAALLHTPVGICMDNAGNIYFADQGNHVIRKIAAGTGIIKTIAGIGTLGYSGDGGPATAAKLGAPGQIKINGSGDLFFSDGYLGVFKIRKIDAATGNIYFIAGGTGSMSDPTGIPATSASLGSVDGLCVDGAGNIYVNETSCTCSRINIPSGMIYLTAGLHDRYNGDNFNSLLCYFDWPAGLCTDAKQNLYVADNMNNRIRKSIWLTHTPAFAFGQKQSTVVCAGYYAALDSQMMMVDIDSGQAETFVVLAGPAHGSLSGFPAVAMSNGTYSTAIPPGLSYIPAGTYTGQDSFSVIVTDGALSDTVTVYVTVNPGITGGTGINGADSVCVGSTLVLGSYAPGGTFSGSDITIATVTPYGYVYGLLPGKDTITYFVCDPACGTVNDKKVISVDQLPSPVAMAISGPASVCAGASITLTDAIAGGGWGSYNSNATVSGSGYVTGVSPGTDTIFYSVTNACGMERAAFGITVDDCPSLGGKNPEAPSPRIYPSPVSSILNVELPGLPDHSTIAISDITGRIMRNEAVGNGRSLMQIDVSDFAPGVYFIQLNGTEVRRFAKQ